jgi:hypothetical protein
MKKNAVRHKTMILNPAAKVTLKCEEAEKCRVIYKVII